MGSSSAPSPAQASPGGPLECVELRYMEEDVAAPNHEARDGAPDNQVLVAQGRDDSSTARAPVEGWGASRTNGGRSDEGAEPAFFHSPTVDERDRDDDSSSFNLWGHSFDSMSETGAYLREAVLQQPSQQPNQSTVSPRSRGLDISLPTLHYPDLSPIKQVFGEREEEDGRSHRRSPALLEPLPLHPPDDAPVDNYSNPLFVLRSSRRAFVDCTFLLSCLRQPEPCTINMSNNGPIHLYQGRSNRAYHENMTHPRDVAIATRRVGAAICAFGGTVKHRALPPVPSTGSSIFRPKGQPNGRSLYEERFHYRYHLMNGSQVCWDLEEDPPVERSANGLPSAHVVNSSSSGGSSRGTRRFRQDDRKTPKSPNGSSRHASTAPNSDGSSRSARSTPSPTPSELLSGMNPPKLKYRCKLCGKPKNNHVCPYRQSIQRSIGVMVQPAINSFTAHEPGELTPALSEMNNFVSYDSADHCPAGQLHPTPSTMTRLAVSALMHTTEAVCIAGITQSPQSSLSTQGCTPVTTPNNASAMQTHPGKRTHSEMESSSELSPHVMPRPAFASMVALRPEQYRAVTPAETQDIGAFQYPAVPLTFAERRRLSDTLFVLSQQIPPITEECTAILHDARGRGLWDLAVAELLAQVVVGLYCVEGDERLDGLQSYLLGLGISC